MEQTTEGEGPASETGRGLFALRKQFARASRAFRYLRRPVSFLPLRYSVKSQATFPREAFIKVRIEGYRVKIGWRSSGSRGGGNKLCRDTLARTLPAKFVEEVILLQRRPLPQ